MSAAYRLCVCYYAAHRGPVKTAEGEGVGVSPGGRAWEGHPGKPVENAYIE